MAASAIIIIGLLILILGGIVGYTLWTSSNNIEKTKQSTMTPFLGQFNSGIGSTDPPNSDETITPVLTCPSGSSINIINAFSQVTDPYGACVDQTQTPTAITPQCGIYTSPYANEKPNSKIASPTVFALNGQDWVVVTPTTSGNTSPYPAATLQFGNKCSGNADCGNNMICDTNAKMCRLQNLTDLATSAPGKKQAQCTDIGLTPVFMVDPTGQAPSDWYCVDPNVCFGLTVQQYNITDGNQVSLSPPTLTRGSNYICGPTGAGACAIRDASAFIASKCNGQQTCNLMLSDFGPLPCSNVTLPTTNMSSITQVPGTNTYLADRSQSDFYGLPFNYGTSNNSSPTLGYTVHGLYTCV